MKEIWKNIEGYEGFYQVSNTGNVRSLDRIINAPTIFGEETHILKKGKILKGRYSKIKRKKYVNYQTVALLKDGKRKQFYIHRLVASSFIPNPENKPQIDHIDGNPHNNCVENLRWCTQKENNNNPISIFNKSITYNGERARDIAKRNGITRVAFSLRLHYGWSLEDAITKPMRKSNFFRRVS